MTVRVVIYATHSDGMFDILMDMLSKRGYDKVDVIGWGETWQGFHHRTIELHKYISRLPSTELVVCIDGFDTLVIDTPHELLTKFHAVLPNGKACVWSCDGHRHGITDTVFGGRLNGGMYMGYAGALANIYSIVIDTYGTATKDMDDQKLINTMYKKNTGGLRDIIHADMDGRVFANVSYANSLNYIVPRRSTDTYKIGRLNYRSVRGADGSVCIEHTSTGIRPAFVSGPGNSDMSTFIVDLGYKDNYPQRDAYMSTTVLKNFWLEVVVFTSMVILVIFCILCVFACFCYATRSG